MSEQHAQQPDTAIGNYYVSVVDGGKTGLLAGPFHNDHAAALAMVDKAREEACKVNDRAWWYAYGTVRMPLDYAKPGVLNKLLGIA